MGQMDDLRKFLQEVHKRIIELKGKLIEAEEARRNAEARLVTGWHRRAVGPRGDFSRAAYMPDMPVAQAERSVSVLVVSQTHLSHIHHCFDNLTDISSRGGRFVLTNGRRRPINPLCLI